MPRHHYRKLSRGETLLSDRVVNGDDDFPFFFFLGDAFGNDGLIVLHQKYCEEFLYPHLSAIVSNNEASGSSNVGNGVVDKYGNYFKKYFGDRVHSVDLVPKFSTFDRNWMETIKPEFCRSLQFEVDEAEGVCSQSSAFYPYMLWKDDAIPLRRFPLFIEPLEAEFWQRKFTGNPPASALPHAKRFRFPFYDLLRVRVSTKSIVDYFRYEPSALLREKDVHDLFLRVPVCDMCHGDCGGCGTILMHQKAGKKYWRNGVLDLENRSEVSLRDVLLKIANVIDENDLLKRFRGEDIESPKAQRQFRLSYILDRVGCIVCYLYFGKAVVVC